MSEVKAPDAVYARLIDMAHLHGHIYPMKVKTAEFKNNLSRYLRQVQEHGITIVICDRDRPVACLAPLPAAETDHPEWKKESAELFSRFEKAGLDCRLSVHASAGLPRVKPSEAPDGRTDMITVEAMRGAKNW